MCMCVCVGGVLCGHVQVNKGAGDQGCRSLQNIQVLNSLELELWTNCEQLDRNTGNGTQVFPKVTECP